tara:strand:- start:20244 stop:20411 length:168 start_codon:yes stop_codon:yes gene_type:complete
MTNDNYINRNLTPTFTKGDDVVFLIGFSGYFACEFLKHFTPEMLIAEGVVKLKGV